MALPRLEIRTLFYVIFGLTLFIAVFIDDPDLFFHLKAGEDLLRSGTIPEVDHYSFTHEGQPWRAHEWLFEIVIYLLFRYSGYLGIKIFIAAMGVAAVVISAAALSERRSRELPLVVLCALLLVPFLMPRPHLFTLLFFAIYLFALLRYKYRGERYHLWGLPLLMAAWVNLHGGFLLGMVTIAVFIGAEGFTAVWQRRLGSEWPRLRPLLLTGLAVAAASLLNPWGAKQWLFPLELMGNSTMAMISEWQPLNFDDLHARLYLVALSLLLLLYLQAWRRIDLTELLVPWGLVVASLLSVRHMALALLAMLPFMVLMQQRLLASAGWQHSRWINTLRQHLGGGKELGRSEQLLNGLLLLSVGVLFVPLYSQLHRNDAQLLNKRLPVGATEFVLESGLQGRLFNTYHYGGYLIYRLAPQQQVFIDIRGDIYGERVMQDYFTLYNALDGWRTLLQRYAIDFMVVEQNAPLAAAVVEAGLFATVYRDSNSVVLVRNESRYQPLIEAWRSAHRGAAGAETSSAP